MVVAPLCFVQTLGSRSRRQKRDLAEPPLGSIFSELGQFGQFGTALTKDIRRIKWFECPNSIMHPIRQELFFGRSSAIGEYFWRLANRWTGWNRVFLLCFWCCCFKPFCRNQHQKRHGFRHVSSIHQVHLRSYLSLVSLRHRDIGKKPGHFFSFAFSVRFFQDKKYKKWQSLMRKKWPKNGHAVLRFGLDLDLGSGALKTWEWTSG